MELQQDGAGEWSLEEATPTTAQQRGPHLLPDWRPGFSAGLGGSRSRSGSGAGSGSGSRAGSLWTRGVLLIPEK